MKAVLKQDRSGLLPIDYMFCGFHCTDLVRKEFNYFNGIRVLMRKPTHPCKIGVYINTALSEYEYFVGHVVDIDPSPDPLAWVEYEIPINLMINNYIKSSHIHCNVEDNFIMRGIGFHVERQNSEFDAERDLDDTGEPIPINF